VLLARGKLLAANQLDAARSAETVCRRVLLAASQAWNLSFGHGLLVLLPCPNIFSLYTSLYSICVPQPTEEVSYLVSKEAFTQEL
jgi:hypothetical protein